MLFSSGMAATSTLLLSLLGGIAGVGLGTAATTTYAISHGWAIVLPALGWAGGLGSRSHRAHLVLLGLHPRVPRSRTPRRTTTGEPSATSAEAGGRESGTTNSAP